MFTLRRKTTSLDHTSIIHQEMTEYCQRARWYLSAAAAKLADKKYGKATVMVEAAESCLGMIDTLHGPRTTVWSDGKVAYIVCSAPNVKPTLQAALSQTALLTVRIELGLLATNGVPSRVNMLDLVEDCIDELLAMEAGRTNFRMLGWN